MTMIQNDVKDVDDEFVDSESDGEGEFNKRVGNMCIPHHLYHHHHQHPNHHHRYQKWPV